MKILVCDRISDEALTLLRERGGFSVDVKEGMSEQQLKEVIVDCDAIVVRSATKVTKDVISSAKRLRVIARGGVGLDNIDVEEAKRRGIEVINTRAASSVSVAELTIGLMISSCRDIPLADSSLRQGKWEKKKLMGIELMGKTLGILGIGNIGFEVARRAASFGMKLVGYDPAFIDQIPERIKSCGIEMVGFEQLLKSSDFITLHLPLLPETRHLIGRREFEMMKDGVTIINCARGGIIDEDALLHYLKVGKVRRACLDVYEVEPPVGNPLLKEYRVIATPHIGAATVEGQSRIGIEIAEMLIQKLKSS
jgi:D-3-phosphoglycerate dehydrogenase